MLLRRCYSFKGWYNLLAASVLVLDIFYCAPYPGMSVACQSQNPEQDFFTLALICTIFLTLVVKVRHTIGCCCTLTIYAHIISGFLFSGCWTTSVFQRFTSVFDLAPLLPVGGLGVESRNGNVKIYMGVGESTL